MFFDIRVPFAIVSDDETAPQEFKALVEVEGPTSWYLYGFELPPDRAGDKWVEIGRDHQHYDLCRSIALDNRPRITQWAAEAWRDQSGERDAA